MTTSRFAAVRPLRIVIPGGSGQVGRVLARHFQRRGDHVVVLTRGPHTAEWQTVHWDAQTPGLWTQYLEGADVCINLTGRSVNCRYTPDNRVEIYNSRIVSTRLLGEVIASLQNPPRVWLNASTATIYRHALDRPMDEKTGELGGGEPGAPDTWNFSIRVAKDWETAFFKADTPHTRKVAMRSAITFSPVPGNAFAVLSNLVRVGLGGKQGNGRQWVSWIHEDDFARAVEFLIAREDHGWCQSTSRRPTLSRIASSWPHCARPGTCRMEFRRRPRCWNCGVLHANGNRTGVEEPASRSDAAARCRIRISDSELGARRRGPGREMA